MEVCAFAKIQIGYFAAFDNFFSHLFLRSRYFSFSDVCFGESNFGLLTVFKSCIILKKCQCCTNMLFNSILQR